MLDRPRLELVPWHLKKARSGRPKCIDSAGFACSNPLCHYYGCTDPAIHALVSDGQRNGIQYWRCQACDCRKTSRWGTSVYRLKTPLDRIQMVMTALTEGLDQAIPRK